METKSNQKQLNCLIRVLEIKNFWIFSWWIVFAEWLDNERRLALVPTGISVRFSNSPTSYEQCFNLSRPGFLELSCVILMTTTSQRQQFFQKHFWICLTQLTPNSDFLTFARGIKMKPREIITSTRMLYSL